jgi:AMP-binding enzyme
VDALADDPQRLINTLTILPGSERRQLLIGFNGTAVDYPHDRLIHQLFEDQVQQTPDATALVYEARSLSYRALNQQANRLAHYLLDLGIRPDDRVAICVERSLDLVVGLLGILKAGGAYVPLDPGYPNERLAFMLGDAPWQPGGVGPDGSGGAARCRDRFRFQPLPRPQPRPEGLGLDCPALGLCYLYLRFYRAAEGGYGST